MKRTLISIVGAVGLLALAACSATTEGAPSGLTSSSILSPQSASPKVLTPSEPDAAPVSPTSKRTQITITAGGQTFSARLNSSDVARDFAAMLPLTVPMFRNAGIEFIHEFSAPLSEVGPFYTSVEPGDLVYWNPADSITIIYEETSAPGQLTKMGKITSDITGWRELPNNVDVTFELA